MVQKDLLGTISPTNDKKVTEISARVGVSLNALNHTVPSESTRIDKSEEVDWVNRDVHSSPVICCQPEGLQKHNRISAIQRWIVRIIRNAWNRILNPRVSFHLLV